MFERARQGAVDVIRGDAPLKADALQELARLLAECQSRGQPRVVVDLGKVPLIDSAGLELLLGCHESFQQRGGALRLAAPNPLCQEILLVTGVDRQIEVFSDAVAAMGSFAQ